MPAHSVHLTRTQQDELLLRIYGVAVKAAREWIPAQRREDAVHEFILRVLLALRRGRWTNPRLPLERFVELRLLDRKSVETRSRARGAKRDLQYLKSLELPLREWMQTEYVAEYARLQELTLQILAPLPRRAVTAFTLVRAKGLTYAAAARKLRLSRNAVHEAIVLVNSRLRAELPRFGIHPAARNSENSSTQAEKASVERKSTPGRHGTSTRRLEYKPLGPSVTKARVSPSCRSRRDRHNTKKP